MGTESYKSKAVSLTYFPALTGLRAVVAFQVFFFHVTSSVKINTFPLATKWLIRVLQQGDIGVSVFFMLSGFLITGRYLNSIELTGAWFRRYLQNRFARIYPIYFVLTALSFAAMLVRPVYNWYQWPVTFDLFDKTAAIFLNFTLTRAFFQQMVFLGLPTAWSLTVEESFYLSAPFLLLGLKHNFRRIYFYPVLLLATGILLVLLCTQFAPVYGLMSSLSFMLTFTFFGRCIEFIVGIWLAFRLARPANAKPVLARHATLLGGAGIVVVMLALGAVDHSLFAKELPYANWTIKSILLPIPIALLLWGLIKERTWVQRLLQTKLFDVLGKSSYIFYLIHLGIIDTLFMRYVTDNWAARLLAYNLLSLGLYTWIERPMHKLLRAKPRTTPEALPKEIASPANAVTTA